MLRLESIDVFYGKAQALHDVSLEAGEGEVVALVGRNGAGKTTLLRAAAGLLPLSGGRRWLAGADASALPPHRLAREGVVLVPDNRQIFPNLTVMENLEVATLHARRGGWTVARALELFPRLAERGYLGGSMLSGGEQQMLAIARGVLMNPRVLLLDEPTEGLAPVIVEALVKAIREIGRVGALSVVLVEQNFAVPLQLASRFYIMDAGRVARHGTRADFDADQLGFESIVSV